MKKLRLGIIGMSEGNGHPYSWSAICNGFDPQEMGKCPFPVIPQYLAQQSYPADFIRDAEVTHVWTQDPALSQSIARSSKIGNVVDSPEKMIGAADGLLLARDDAENHLALATPFLKAGIPVFLDKPAALSEKALDTLLALEKYEGQIFTCSALRFSRDLALSREDRQKIGHLKSIHGRSPKYWKTYSVHIIESVISTFPDLGEINRSQSFGEGDITGLKVEWNAGVTGTFETTGPSLPQPIQITYVGEDGTVTKTFGDSFYSFREALWAFIRSIQQKRRGIPLAETRMIINLIERGMK